MSRYSHQNTHREQHPLNHQQKHFEQSQSRSNLQRKTYGNFKQNINFNVNASEYIPKHNERSDSLKKENKDAKPSWAVNEKSESEDKSVNNEESDECSWVMKEDRGLYIFLFKKN